MSQKQTPIWRATLQWSAIWGGRYTKEEVRVLLDKKGVDYEIKEYKTGWFRRSYLLTMRSEDKSQLENLGSMIEDYLDS